MIFYSILPIGLECLFETNKIKTYAACTMHVFVVLRKLLKLNLGKCGRLPNIFFALDYELLCIQHQSQRVPIVNQYVCFIL